MPLGIPDSTQRLSVAALEASDAVILFAHRARAAKADFVIDKTNAGLSLPFVLGWTVCPWP